MRLLLVIALLALPFTASTASTTTFAIPARLTPVEISFAQAFVAAAMQNPPARNSTRLPASCSATGTGSTVAK